MLDDRWLVAILVALALIWITLQEILIEIKRAADRNFDSGRYWRDMVAITAFALVVAAMIYGVRWLIRS